MGVQGLTSLLERCSQPTVVCRRHGQDAAGPKEQQVLLVDASCVHHYLVQNLGPTDWKTTAFHAELYRKTLRFYQAIQRAGLRCVLVLDGAPAAGLEECYATRRRKGLEANSLMPPTAESVISQAYQDLGLQVLRAASSADSALWAYYVQHRNSVFAILTNDSDFYVLGAQAIVHVEGIVADARSTTFHLWRGPDCWSRFHKGATGYATVPPLLQRAHVAAVLGNDAGKGVRSKLEARRRGQQQQPARPGAPRLLASPVAIARELLRNPTDDLQLSFFRSAPLSMKSFGEDDFAAFSDIVQGYLAEDAAARRADAELSGLLLGPQVAPWLDPGVAQRLARATPLPSLAVSVASRGFGALTVPQPHWSLMAPVRAAAAARLLGDRAPGAAYQYDASSNSLHVLVPGAAPAAAATAPGSDWFTPELLAAAVAPAAAEGAAAAVLSAQGTLEATAAALAAAYPDAPPSLVQYHALLLHAVEPVEGAWDAAAVRALLLPAGEPLPSEPTDGGTGWPPAAVVGAADEGPGGVAGAGAVAGVVNVGSSLSKEDWEDIDDKDVVAKVQTSLMAKIQPWDPAAAAVGGAAALAQAPAQLSERLCLLLFALSMAPESEAGTNAELWRRLARVCFPHQYAALKAMKGSERKQAVADAAEEAKTGAGMERTSAAAAARGTTKSSRAAAAATAATSGPSPASVLLAALAAQKGSPAAAYASGWIERLRAFAREPRNGMLLLPLARDAAIGGPGSVQWRAMQECWVEAGSRARQEVLQAAWTWDNRSGSGASGGAPMRYAHQQQLMDLLDQHLTEIEGSEGGSRPAPLPLHVILSTPTGSGKTFTAVMMALQGLRPGPAWEGHCSTVLVYSVPTKQVLKRVGQECEAHKIVYWTAATNGELFEVRRPYSVRSRREAKPKRVPGEAKEAKTGSMRDQLEACSVKAKKNNDIAGAGRSSGTPEVIIADITATAALVRAASAASPDTWYHSSHLLLYLDEPNMGLHLNAQVLSAVRSILACAPTTTVLASATLPGWEQLPAWWRGEGRPTTHAIITQEPYELPQSQLAVWDDASGQLVRLSPLDLFPSAHHMAAALNRNPRLRVLLLRHFTPQQAAQLLGLGAGGGAEGAAAARSAGQEPSAQASAPAANGSGGGDAAAAAGEEPGSAAEPPSRASELDAQADGAADGAEAEWALLGQDLRSLREGMLEGALEALDEQRFQALKQQWAAAAPPQRVDSLRDVMSKQGVTLVATLEPRALALQLAGKGADEARWAKDASALKERVRAAAAAQRAARKERDRLEKRGPGGEEGGGLGGGGGDEVASTFQLRSGLFVSAEDADDVQDLDTLVMLSRGVAYASAGIVEPLVKRLYHQALLSVPERSGRQPALHVLVVDYSGVYGTDCPAVDTLVLDQGLGDRMAWEDHQQFIGRLRRDGLAVYPSFDLLHRAVMGAPPPEDAGAQQAQRVGQLVEQLAEQQGADEAAAKAATADAAKQLAALVVPARFSRADAGVAVMEAVVRSLLPVASEPAPQPAALLKDLVQRLERWGSLLPLRLLALLRLARPAEQSCLVASLERLCTGAGGAGVQERHPLPVAVAPRLLQLLADEDLLEEEGLGLWLRQADEAAAGAAAPAPGLSQQQQATLLAARAAFRKAVARVQEYLQSDEEEDE